MVNGSFNRPKPSDSLLTSGRGEGLRNGGMRGHQIQRRCYLFTRTASGGYLNARSRKAIFWLGFRWLGLSGGRLSPELRKFEHHSPWESRESMFGAACSRVQKNKTIFMLPERGKPLTPTSSPTPSPCGFPYLQAQAESARHSARVLSVLPAAPRRGRDRQAEPASPPRRKALASA